MDAPVMPSAATVFDRRSVPDDLAVSTWSAADGWPLRRATWPIEPGQTQRGSLLFANGRGDFVEKYLEALHDWHVRGWEVTTFDWRGQGRSKGDIIAAHVMDFQPMIDDLTALVSEWIATSPAPHVLVAHSMGAHMALRMLVDANPALDAVVLIAPMVEVNPSPMPAWLARIVAGVASRIGFAKRALSAPLDPAPVGSTRQKILTADHDRYEDEQYWWAADPAFKPVSPSFGWIRAAYRSAKAFTRAKIGQVRAPVLFLAAPNDRLVSMPAIRRAAAGLREGEVFVVPDAAHEILRDVDPVRDAAFAKMDAFLAEHAR